MHTFLAFFGSNEMLFWFWVIDDHREETLELIIKQCPDFLTMTILREHGELSFHTQETIIHLAVARQDAKGVL